MTTFFKDSQKRVRRIDDNTNNISSKNLGLDSKSSSTSPEKVESLMDAKKKHFDKTSIDYVLLKAWDLGEQDKTRNLGVDGEETLGYNLSTELISNEPNPKIKVEPSDELIGNDLHLHGDKRLDKGSAYRLMASAFNKKHSIERTTSVISPEYHKKKMFIESSKMMQIKTNYNTDYKTGKTRYEYEPYWSYMITLHKAKRNPKTLSEYFTDQNIDGAIENLRRLEKVDNITKIDVGDWMLIGRKATDVVGNVAGKIADELQYLKDTRK